MNIVICIKQVPDVDDIKWTKENNLDRQGMLSKLNTADEWALDWAIQLKNKYKGVTLTVISMGPSQAKDILEYALAKGANRAILLSDKLFSGSDTLITSKILSRAIKKYIPDFDIILTGQKANDGDTEQVPVSLAECLNIIDLTNVTEIHSADKNIVLLTQKINSKINMYELNPPCLIGIKEACTKIYKPKIKDYIKAQRMAIETYNMEDLELDKTQVGIIGSPTTVNKAFRPQINKNTKEITEIYAKNILDIIFKV